MNYAGDRGNGDYDIRNRFTLSATYELPSKKTKWQMLEGWQVTSIAMLESGLPYTLNDANDDISLSGEFNDRWNMSGPVGNVHWSALNPIPFVDPSQFIEDPVTFDVTGGATPAAIARKIHSVRNRSRNDKRRSTDGGAGAAWERSANGITSAIELIAYPSDVRMAVAIVES